MAKVFVSSSIDAPIAEVWESIRRFDAVAEGCRSWFPVRSRATAGRPRSAQCGSVTQTDGAVFREVLVAHSDADCFYSYTFVGSPIPVRDHLTTLRLRPITDGDRTLREWASRFEIAPDRESELVGMMERNFLAGLRAIAERAARE